MSRDFLRGEGDRDLAAVKRGIRLDALGDVMGNGATPQ